MTEAEPVEVVQTTRERQPKAHYLSPTALRVLEKFVQHGSLKKLQLTEPDTEHLASGIGRLYNALPGNKPGVDFKRISEVLLSPNGSTRRISEEVLTGTTPQNAAQALKRLTNRISNAYPEGVALTSLFELGSREDEPQVPKRRARSLGNRASMGVIFTDHAPVVPAPIIDPVVLADRVQQNTEDEYSQDEPLAWRVDAFCAQTDPEVFFPDGEEAENNSKEICSWCKVKDICLRYALSNNEEFGTWGGFSASERQNMVASLNVA